MFSKELINAFSKQETPFYYYDLGLLRKTLAKCKEESSKYGFHVHYALKANFNEKVLNEVKSYGLGVDCVSGNEVKKAFDVGFLSNSVVFAGVGKSDKEINYALDKGIFSFNVESLQELEVINQLAKNKNVKAAVAIRINPNVDAKTHKYITTGLDENKFGVNAFELPLLKELLQKSSNVELIGMHFHVGSQILDFSVFENLCKKVNEMQDWFVEQGFSLKVINVGGGLGVDYQDPDVNSIVDFESYFSLFDRCLKIDKSKQEVHFELGRSLVAQSGSLISKVLYTKKGLKKNILILDAGMTELIRPALYQTYHKVQNLTSASDINVRYDVVGPICESSDTFAKDLPLPQTERGDIVALRSTGAYGEVMASRYNLRDEIRHFYSE